MAVTHNNKVQLHWEAQGQGSAVLLIMGHRYSARMWYPAIPALATRHRVIYFDNRGTGDSDSTSPLSLQQMLSDVLAVMQAAGVERAHVYGVSMGGGIALEFAQQHPERVLSLVLGCTALFSAEKKRMPKWLRLLYFMPPKFLAWVMRRMRSGQHGYGSAASADQIAFDQLVMAQDRYSMRGVAAQAGAVGNYSTTREQVAALTMPALVLHGDEDLVVPHSFGVELAEVLPDSRLVTLAGAGHNFLIAAGVQANRTVLDFLDEVDRRYGASID